MNLQKANDGSVRSLSSDDPDGRNRVHELFTQTFPRFREFEPQLRAAAQLALEHAGMDLAKENRDRIGVMMRNSLLMPQVYWGATRCGVFVTMLSTHLKPEEARYILGDPMAPWHGGAASLTTEFIKKYPDVAKKYMAAYKRGVDLVKSKPDEARAALEKAAAIEPLHREITITVGHQPVRGQLHLSTLPDSQVRVYLVEQSEYFDRPSLYVDKEKDYRDNCERFAFFSRAVIVGVGRCAPVAR